MTKIMELLDGVIHPESGQGLAAGGFVESVSEESEGSGVGSGESRGSGSGERRGVTVVLKFRRARDPFAASLRRQAEAVLTEAFPGREVSVRIAEPATPPTPSRRLPGVERVIAVSGGKGGVGKSTVAAQLAMTLAAEGWRVGILDADIYGPSQPALFGVEDYLPVARSTGDETGEDQGRGGGELSTIVPAEGMGVKIMSIGFFISPSDALVWRGPMAVSALRQLIHQTAWGTLDWLLVDLPPGTGDVHLSLVKELEVDGAIIVTTPQSLAIADARRGVEMLRADGVGVPVLGVVGNMAWFTPTELPDNRYFIFGKEGARTLAAEENIDYLGDIPLVMAAAKELADEPGGGEKSLTAQGVCPQVAPYFQEIARRIVGKFGKRC